MKLFLNGGGVLQPKASQYYRPEMAGFYKLLGAAIDTSKPILYIPFAKTDDLFAERFGWFKAEMATAGISCPLEMAESGEAVKNLSDYACLYFGGGNTFKLLKELKESGAFSRVREYLLSGGVAYGSSAGAIIFGRDINSTLYSDSNETVGLKDTAGFDMLGGMSVAAHFGNDTPESAEGKEKYLLEYSKKEPVIAIAEQGLVCVDDAKMSVVGKHKFFDVNHNR